MADKREAGTSKYFLWSGKIVPTDEFVKEFLELTGVYLAKEGMSEKVLTAIEKRFHLDIFKFDAELARLDPEYDPKNCTYKGVKNYSINKYMKEKFGERSVEMLDQIINDTFPGVRLS